MLHMRIYTRLYNTICLFHPPFLPSIKWRKKALPLCKELWKSQNKKTKLKCSEPSTRLAYQFMDWRMPRADAKGNTCWRHLFFKGFTFQSLLKKLIIQYFAFVVAKTIQNWSLSSPSKSESLTLITFRMAGPSWERQPATFSPSGNSQGQSARS